MPNVYLRTKQIPEIEQILVKSEKVKDHDNRMRKLSQQFEEESLKYTFTTKRIMKQVSTLDKSILEKMVQWESKGI